MTKFWNAAIWSNFSAHSPATSPSAPMIAAPATAKTRIHAGSAAVSGANQTVTSSTPVPTTSPRTTAAPTYARNHAQWLSGVTSSSTRLPVILLWISDDELLAKAFCSTLIITSPGTRKLV